MNIISINPLYRTEKETLLKPNAFQHATSGNTESKPMRKKAKRKVSFEDIEAAGKHGTEDFHYFLEHGKLPFTR